MAHDARAVANYFLDKAKKDQSNLTPMHILKLVYIAHGWTLAITGKPLIQDTIYAWEFGPVIGSLYDAFKRFGGDPITDYARDVYESKKVHTKLTDEEREVVDSVWEVYGHLEAFQLSGLTHTEGTPWHRVWHEEGGKRLRNAVIPDDSIKAHFKAISEKNANR